MAEVTRRKRTPSARAVFSRDDLQMVLKMPLLAAVALFLPERKWMAFCTAMERVAGSFSAARADRIRAGLGRAGQSSRDGAIRVLASQSEHHIQVLRDYLGGWRPRLELTGREHLDAARRGGRGAVLWVAHFSFNTLASKIALADAGYEVHHVSRPEHGFTKSRFGIRFLNPIRIASELKHLGGRVVIDRDNPSASMNEARRLLQDNRFVSITAGAWEGQLLAKAAVAGGSIELSSGAPRLANVARAPLIPIFVVRDDHTGMLSVIVEPPIAIDRSADRETMITAAAEEFAARHDKYLRRYPYQWRDWEKLKPAE